jgi:hypothetical protein
MRTSNDEAVVLYRDTGYADNRDALLRHGKRYLALGSRRDILRRRMNWGMLGMLVAIREMIAVVRRIMAIVDMG